MPKISIIIPVYNSATYLQKCIESVLSQSFIDFEIILINDGSKDTSGELCDKYSAKDTRIRVYHKDNEGVSSARNFGLDHAKGEWVIFLDSDDWIDGNMLFEMYDKALYENADIVYGDMKMYSKDHTDILHIAAYDSKKNKMLRNFIVSAFSTVVGMLVKKSIYDLNNIRFPIGIRYCEDFYVAIRLVFYSKCVSYLPSPYYCYNKQNESSASQNYSPKYYDSVQWVYSDTIEFFKKKGEYNKYAKALSWKLLNSKQEMVLDKSTYDKFLSINPDSHKYIWNCPFLNLKIKIMMWALVHNLRFITDLILYARRLRQSLNINGFVKTN